MFNFVFRLDTHTHTHTHIHTHIHIRTQVSGTCISDTDDSLLIKGER